MNDMFFSIRRRTVELTMIELGSIPSFYPLIFPIVDRSDESHHSFFPE